MREEQLPFFDVLPVAEVHGLQHSLVTRAGVFHGIDCFGTGRHSRPNPPHFADDRGRNDHLCGASAGGGLLPQPNSAVPIEQADGDEASSRVFHPQ